MSHLLLNPDSQVQIIYAEKNPFPKIMVKYINYEEFSSKENEMVRANAQHKGTGLVVEK